MATIKAIDGRSVHQIQSGQVIVDLCSVVKELVENSLDAGATSIDVRFKAHGLDAIEVQDNGNGIAPEDYDTVALKHYTSKLSTYDDLNSLRTFGFRGEALSSLCALSNFHITTARSGDAPRGTRLEYERSGKLKEKSVIASQRGTTVSVESIFLNLPVRRKELEKNIKREYGKALGLLQSYACISTGVKFSVSNQPPKAAKVVAFSTKSNTTTKDNITNVYGAKTTAALVALDLELEMQPATGPGTQSLRNWTDQGDSSHKVHIKGHMSRPIVGEGRQTPDRQMFFVNSRPCALPQVAKAFNEVYKSYNVTQSPFIFADLIMDTNAYDVNVSPDKRTILLHDQNALLEALKAKLIELFDNHDQSVPQADLMNAKAGKFKTPLPRKEKSIVEVLELTRKPSSSPTPGEKDQHVTRQRNGRSLDATSPPQLLQGGVNTNVHEPRGFIPASKIMSTPKEAERLATALEKEAPERRGEARHTARTMPPKLVSSTRLLQDLSDSPSDSQNVPQFVADVNARLAGQGKTGDFADGATSAGAHVRVEDRSDQSEDEPVGEVQAQSVVDDPVAEDDAPDEPREERIFASKPGSPAKTLGPVQNAFDRMRPKRTFEQAATVTIGEVTTHFTLGSAPKKLRMHTAKLGLGGSRLSQAGPLISKSLRRFAAPGTEFFEDDPEEEEEERETRRRKTSALELESPADDGAAAELEDVRSDVSDDDDDDDEDGPTKGSHDLSVEDENGSDDEYLDETGKKQREDERVAKMIAKAEESAARPTKDNIKRAAHALRGRQRKDSTLQLVQRLQTSVSRIEKGLRSLTHALQTHAERRQREQGNADSAAEQQPAAKTAEERLSLTVSKSDFARMRIVGQFNLGFIVALRPGASPASSPAPASHPTRKTRPTTDDLFIIDQHAADEKYNFERLSSTTVLATQPLVHPLALALSALDEEIIQSHPAALAQNGFVIALDATGRAPVGTRCKLVGLPSSRDVVFDTRDLEELVALLGEHHVADSAAPGAGGDDDARAGPRKGVRGVPRPAKARRLLAMRACRGSVMVGTTLGAAQMRRVVRHMGEMDKPWNCPHGRPTMRHLFGFGAGQLGGDDGDGGGLWREGMGVVGLGEEDGDGGFVEAWRGMMGAG